MNLLSTYFKRFCAVTVMFVVLAAASHAEEGQGLSDAASDPRNQEWLDRGLPWWQWSRLTGNWNDWRTRFEEHGLVIEGSWLNDTSKVESGGVRRRTTSRSIFTIDVSLDLEPLLAIPNATIGAQFYSRVGRDGSLDSGDLQVYSNFDADRLEQLAELWYEQRWFHDRLRVKLGKMDANGEFAFVESAGEFIHSSMGFSPTILSFPTYPEPAVGAVAFAQATDWFETGVGLFDGALQEGERTGRKGAGTVFGDPSDLILLGEARVTWELPFRSLAGRFVIGGWHHTGRFARFTGGPDSGAEGYYLIAEQALWTPAADSSSDTGADFESDSERGLTAFFQYAVADEAISELTRHIGLGISWRGPLAARPDDVFGVGASYVELSDRPGSGLTEGSEVAHEIFYLAQLTPWLFVQPDVQYITDPGGDATLGDAVVITVRVGLLF